LKCHRSGLITFCGLDVQTEYDPNGVDAKEGFRLYDDGKFSRGKPIKTKHPNILKSIIIGKKGWGLWLNQWGEGINEWSFTKEEILDEFKVRGIVIPESFLKDFENRIQSLRLKRLNSYWEELQKE